jgi:hypothetical protein
VIELRGNRISGPVLLVNKPGTATPISPAAAPSPQIEANMIGGSLSCSGNVLTSTEDLLPNSVQGPGTGQCAGLAH